jgi:Domain of unknown function (DUF4440)
MKLFLSILFFLTSLVSAGQVDSVSLKEAMANLDRALLNKDEKALGQLLHRDASYGHSNGWVQSKNDIINDLKTGKMVYDKIENTSIMLVAINKNWATVRTITNVQGRTATTPSFDLKLHVLQLWFKTKNRWQLLARQSTKL